jgi:hypothetical protein
MSVIKKKKRSAKNIGKLARRKGHGFEREVAAQLRLVFPGARRHLEYQDAEANGIDLVNTGHYKIQCKRGRKYASLSAIKEVQCEEMLGDVPVLITQGDNEPALVVIPMIEFLRLLKSQTSLPLDNR